MSYLLYIPYNPCNLCNPWFDNTIIGDAAEPVLDPASVAGAQVIRTAMPAVWDWPLDAPVKLVAKDAAGKPLALVPYGCTKLRVSMFPVE